MPQVKVTAYVTNEETRIIDCTDEELAELQEGGCGKIIEESVWDDRGKFVESSTSSVQADRWEVVSEPTSAATEPETVG